MKVPAGFRVRPVEVKAIQWVGEANCAEVFAFLGWDHAAWADETDHSEIHIPDLARGPVTARHGDWLVLDKHGVTVLNAAEFEAKYEPLPGGAAE